MTKTVIDSDIPFLQGVLEPYTAVERVKGSLISPEHLRDARALVIRTRTRCDASLLEGSGVRIIATATIGTDHIDLEWCRRNGITVCNAAGCNARGVLHWVAAVLVHLARTKGLAPDRCTLGIIGVGHVGELVRQYARHWGFRTVCCDPPRQISGESGFVTAREVFERADIVTLHVPLDGSTRHLVDRRMLEGLPHRPFIINSSRGEVVDTLALLESGCRFALDVWENEPRINLQALQRAEIATPHIAGYSLQGKANASAMAVQALARHFGWPLRQWHPGQAGPALAAMPDWNELCSMMAARYDIAEESRRLKSHPEDFEAMRNGYHYRCEFF